MKLSKYYSVVRVGASVSFPDAPTLDPEAPVIEPEVFPDWESEPEEIPPLPEVDPFEPSWPEDEPFPDPKMRHRHIYE